MNSEQITKVREVLDEAVCSWEIGQELADEVARTLIKYPWVLDRCAILAGVTPEEMDAKIVQAMRDVL